MCRVNRPLGQGLNDGRRIGIRAACGEPAAEAGIDIGGWSVLRNGAEDHHVPGKDANHSMAKCRSRLDRQRRLGQRIHARSACSCGRERWPAATLADFIRRSNRTAVSLQSVDRAARRGNGSVNRSGGAALVFCADFSDPATLGNSRQAVRRPRMLPRLRLRPPRDARPMPRVRAYSWRWLFRGEMMASTTDVIHACRD